MIVKYVFSFLCYYIYVFFLQKQEYASRHYTGSSNLMVNIIRIFAFASSLFGLYYLVISGIKIAWFLPIIMVLSGIVAHSFISRIVIRITTRSIYQGNEDADVNTKWCIFNRRQDIVSTFCAILGLIVIPITGYVMITLLNSL